MAKDYYKILGVDKEASQDDVKKAYRKMAHEHHPDKEGGDEEKFKEVNEAYQVLGDEKKRSTYDQFGTADFGPGGSGGPGGMNWEDIMRQGGFASGGPGGSGGAGGVEFDLGDIFSELFGGAGRGGGRKKSNRGQDIQIDMNLDFKDAAFGTQQTVDLMRGVKCTHCSGNGAEPGTPIKECKTCSGSGAVESMQRSVFGAIRTQTICHECKGQGKNAETKCSKCTGSGIERVESTLEIDIPGGIDDGQTIRVSGQGEAGLHGAPAGDLYVTVHVKQHERWQRDGDDIIEEVSLPYSTLALGGKINVETLDGDMTVKIPAGTEAGKSLRLRNKGIPSLQGSSRGDHIVQVRLSVHKRPSAKIKKLLKELQKLEGNED